MKKIFIILISLFLASTANYAQNCGRKLTKGSTWEYTTYNRKGKVIGKFRYELIDVKKEASSTTYLIESKNYNKKDKLQDTFQYEEICKNGNIYIDMKRTTSGMNSNKPSENEDIEITVKSSMLDYPGTSVAPGTMLDNGSFTATSKSEFITTEISIDVSNRKAESIEDKQTPAGTFKCVKITSDIDSKIVIVNQSGKGIEWYNEGVGLVYSEYYNQKGNLFSYSVLTGLNIK